MIVELGLDVVTRAAFAVAVLFRRVLRIWIAALDHEAFDDPVENRAVIETLARQFLEIVDRVWCGIGPKLYNHIAFAGDRKSTRLNSSHITISYAVFCLK